MTFEKRKTYLASIDYGLLNEKLQNYNHYLLEYTPIFKKLALMVMENYPKIRYEENYKVEVPPNRTVEYVTSFFYEISPDYANRFLNILSEVGLTSDEHAKNGCTVVFQKEGKSRSYNTGRTEINLTDRIHDTYGLMHEATHKIMRPYRQVSILRTLLPEIPALSLEFVLYDFLMNKVSCEPNSDALQRDIAEFFDYRFTGTSESAVKLLIECELFELFQKKGPLDEGILTDYISSLSDEYPFSKQMLENYFLSRIDKMSQGTLKIGFSVNLRYVLALIVACDFRTKIKSDSKEIQNVLAINDLLGSSDDELVSTTEKLKELGLSFFGTIRASSKDVRTIITDEHFLDFSDELLTRYESNLQNVIDEIFKGASKHQKIKIIKPQTPII